MTAADCYEQTATSRLLSSFSLNGAFSSLVGAADDSVIVKLPQNSTILANSFFLVNRLYLIEHWDSNLTKANRASNQLQSAEIIEQRSPV